MGIQPLIADAGLAGGVRVGGRAGTACQAIGTFLVDCLGLPAELWRKTPDGHGQQSSGAAFSLSAEAFEALMPGYDTLALQTCLDTASIDGDRALEREIAVALLGSPVVRHFDSALAFISHVRVQRRVCQAARQTAVAFKTRAAERPQGLWVYDEDAGFLLAPQAGLVAALQAATQPSVTGQLYDFSCYRASEYVMLLGIAQELELHDEPMLQRLQARCRRRAIRSREFHDVFLDEIGSLEDPMPSRYFVPGERLWFRNPDARSSDVLGYEGSWVIYLGGGLFSNFWKQSRPYTLEDKCLEIFHWRDGAYCDDAQQWQMDEAAVEACVARTESDEAHRSRVLQRMMRMRDPQGVYAEGGCLDASREQPKSVWPGFGRLQFDA